MVNIIIFLLGMIIGALAIILWTCLIVSAEADRNAEEAKEKEHEID